MEAELAATRRSRFWGLMGGEPRPLLVPTASVHGFWLPAPLRVVGIDHNRVVIQVRLLRRRRIVWVPGARWVLELPMSHGSPKAGDPLVFEETR